MIRRGRCCGFEALIAEPNDAKRLRRSSWRYCNFAILREAATAQRQSFPLPLSLTHTLSLSLSRLFVEPLGDFCCLSQYSSRYTLHKSSFPYILRNGRYIHTHIDLLIDQLVCYLFFYSISLYCLRFFLFFFHFFFERMCVLLVSRIVLTNGLRINGNLLCSLFCVWFSYNNSITSGFYCSFCTLKSPASKLSSSTNNWHEKQVNEKIRSVQNEFSHAVEVYKGHWTLSVSIQGIRARLRNRLNFQEYLSNEALDTYAKKTRSYNHAVMEYQ